MILNATVPGRRLPYAAAILIVGLAALVRAAALPSHATYLTFFPAVILTALYGGFLPGLLATGLSAAAMTFWGVVGEPLFSGDHRDWLSLGVFVVSCTMVSGLSGILQRVRARAESAEEQAQLAGERENAIRVQHRTETSYRSLFEHMLDGFAYCKMLFDADGNPEDFIYLDVNPAFTRLTGLKNVVGRKVTEVLPGVKEMAPELLEIYGRVALTGEPKAFEIYFKPLSSWFSISVYSPQRQYFVSIFDNVTELKQAEEEIRNSEERHRKIVEASTDAILVRQACGRIMYANPAALKLLGAHEAGDLIDKTYLDLVHPEDRPGSTERIRKTLKENWIAPARAHRLLTLEGKTVHVESTGVAIQHRGETLIFGVFRDISERKRGEEALRVSHRFLEIVHAHREMDPLLDAFMAEIKAYTNCQAVGIRVLDEEGGISYRTHTGFSQEFLKLENPLSIESDRCMCINVLTGAVDPHLPFYTPGGSFYMNGTSRFLASVSEADKGKTRNMCNRAGYESVALVPFRDGECIRGLIHVADRRESMVPLATVEVLEKAALQLGTAIKRVLTEKALRESQERYRLVADFTHDWEFWLSPEGHFLYVSPSCERISGYPPSFFLNDPRAFLDIVHPHDRSKYEFHLQSQAGSGSTPQELNFRITTRAGDTRWINHMSWGVFSYEGVFMGRRGSNRDITERMRSRQEREKLETQLRQAQKMEAIGTLAGGIAHDFNNILSVILGYAEILGLEPAASPTMKEGLSQILIASQRAKQLVGHILAFSRRSEQQRLLIDLRHIIRETLEFLRASLPSTIQLRHNVISDAGPILADPTQMQQILMNLCTNAAHAMEQKGGILQIDLDHATVSEEDARLDPEAEPGEYVKLTVSDTGPGMEPEVLDRIFEPYFTTKGPGKGTGLGLSVVHGIVRSHGGKIKVHTEAGMGTAFHVYLPRSQAAEKARGSEARLLPRGSENILFVDDEVTLVDMGKQMLAFLGYQVETRTSPIEALEVFRASPYRFAAVVTDMTMPHLTGMDLSKKLLEIRPDIPIVLCTGFSDMASEEKARTAGIRSFLLKPLTMQDLADSLRRALDGDPKPAHPCIP